MVVGALYVIALGGVIAFTVPAAEEAGLPPRQAELLLAVLNLGAAAARLGWGRVADRDAGGRRVRTLVEVGLLGAVSALVFPLALQGGLVTALPAALLLAVGTLGFNGLVYLLAGELAGPGRAGTAVGATATAVFLVGSLAAPLLGVVVEAAGFSAMFAVVAACALAGAVVARGVVMGPPQRVERRASEPAAA
jgi:MFS family permease